MHVEYYTCVIQSVACEFYFFAFLSTVLRTLWLRCFVTTAVCCWFAITSVLFCIGKCVVHSAFAYTHCQHKHNESLLWMSYVLVQFRFIVHRSSLATIRFRLIFEKTKFSWITHSHSRHIEWRQPNKSWHAVKSHWHIGPIVCETIGYLKNILGAFVRINQPVTITE